MRPVLLGILIAGACYAYRPAPLTPAPGSRVRIVLRTATNITTAATAPDTVRHSYPGVLEASGTIVAAASDTVALRLDELRTATGAVADAAGQIALLPTAQIARITERRFQAGTTALTGVAVSTLAVGAFIVLIIVTLTQGF